MREPIEQLVRVEDTEFQGVRLVVNSVVIIEEIGTDHRERLEQIARVIKTAIQTYKGEPEGDDE